jgi:PAS domain S-box-containing protein
MMQESLQQSVMLLEKENQKLRQAITTHIGPAAADEVPDMTAAESVQIQGPGANSAVIKSLQIAQQNFTITDPSLADNPIVYASHGFLTLTGYSLDQVLGRNCRFLQGPHTDSNAIDILRKGIAAGEDVTTVILNYRADGTPFWNQIFISALRDGVGNVVNYLGVQCKVSDLYAEVYLKNEADIIGWGVGDAKKSEGNEKKAGEQGEDNSDDGDDDDDRDGGFDDDMRA